MRREAGFFDIDERLKGLSAEGDNLERLKGLVDFEMFRAALREAGHLQEPSVSSLVTATEASGDR